LEGKGHDRGVLLQEDTMDKAKLEKFLELLDEIVNKDGPLGN